jgi:hypothetical protein
MIAVSLSSKDQNRPLKEKLRNHKQVFGENVAYISGNWASKYIRSQERNTLLGRQEIML